MNFSTALSAPVIVEIDGESIQLPRFTLGDFVDWGAMLDADRAKLATAGMSAMDRFKVLSVYPIAPMDMSELSRVVFTPAGVKYVITTCMKRANVPAEKIEKILSVAHPEELEFLAETLASVSEPRASNAPPKAGKDTSKDMTFADVPKEGESPLPVPAPASQS